ISEGKVGNGYAGRQVLEIDHGVLQLEKLFAPVFQIVHGITGLLFDEVLFASGGDVEQNHASTHALLQVDVLFKLHIGPEVDQLNLVIRRTKSVNAAKALDDADGIPVDVVIDQPVAVLEVLAFRYAVRCNKKVEFALMRQVFRALF